MCQGRLPEITLREMLEVDPVANRQRLVEPVVSFERSNRRRIGGRLLTEIGRNRVARHELREHEDDERDANGKQHERRSATDDEADKAGGRTESTPGPRRIGNRGRRRRQGLPIVASGVALPFRPSTMAAAGR
jgi:hypothetical protein